MSRRSSNSTPRRHPGGHHQRRRAEADAEPQPRKKKRLFNVVPVRFHTNFLKHDYNAQELHLRKGDDVIVETARGPAIARVEGHVRRRLLPAHAIRRVLRKASDADLDQAERNEARELEAYRFALERIRARKMPMKLIRAQYMHDGSKIVFYFSADGRVDFRDLVKDLAHRFRTRIEMHQIGVRDGARMLGGIGPCGRELCCSTFLESFAPVSIRMAKSQGLTLNPRKVSGMCGRLMCCLVYEQQLYKRQRRRMPRPDTKVHTELGPGTITSVDVINERVTVELRDTNRHTLPLAEVSFEEPEAHTVDRHAAPPPIDYDWDDEGDSSSDDSSSSDGPSNDKAQKKSGGRRARRRRSRRRGEEDEKS